jgi:hypothetical protein
MQDSPFLEVMASCRRRATLPGGRPGRYAPAPPGKHSCQRPKRNLQKERYTTEKRGLKKQVITPLDAPQAFLAEARQGRTAQETARDSALVRALGLAHHWQRLLDEERAASVADIAKAEGMDVTQVRRVMQLTLLAPEVIERLLGAPDIVLERVRRSPWPNGWDKQLQVLSLAA